jgi:uncharacterized protein YndB with AHSA1/START domain
MSSPDPSSLFAATERSVTSGTRDGVPLRTVVASRVFATDVADLWDAVTNVERIPRWFLPVTIETEGPPRVGSRYQLKGNAGGEITACDPPAENPGDAGSEGGGSFAVTWVFGPEASWVTVRVAAAASVGDEPRAKLTLEHSAKATPEGEPRWKQFGPGAVGIGWELGLGGLFRHLESGAAVDPKEFEAWSLSAEGKAFVRASSQGWLEASRAFGTPEAEAQAAAAACTAFYTGEPAPEDKQAT